MNVTWILEPDMIGSYCQSLVDEIESQGHIAEIIPTFFTNLDWGDTNRYYDDFAPQQSCVVCHASFQFTSLVAEDEVWTPGTYGINELVDCSNYVQQFSDYLLNDEYEFVTTDELLKNIDSLFNALGENDAIFMRPNSGGKPFTGRLFDRSEITEEHLRRGGISRQMELLVSRPQKILREWRFVIADGNVVTGSMYREFDAIRTSDEVPRDALDFATILAGVYQPDRVWVLDICETNDGRMSVVEINGFSSSNWYQCNLSDIVSTVSGVALDDWKRNNQANAE